MVDAPADATGGVAEAKADVRTAEARPGEAAQANAKALETPKSGAKAVDAPEPESAPEPAEAQTKLKGKAQGAPLEEPAEAPRDGWSQRMADYLREKLHWGEAQESIKKAHVDAAALDEEGRAQAGAAGAARFIQSLPFSVGPPNPMIFGGVALLFAVVAALACLLPSLRASRIDPMEALRTG